MAFGKDHELHQRRFGRNLWVGACLLGFVAIVFGLTVVKVTRDGPIEGFDHTVRPQMTEGAK
ncbi:hypothetical protein BV394_06230 [Brevirhabdus pacifica]|uniref:Uncharacterized protein n=1 Tax=Brevirhabdus pacifica TaxID=1267768 RepID=A0A1U7DH86_9RHOB|nr:hypothetical protein [Brevirhabdus pacifica]APX89364.1 hypothetical protein BV394_06230 [Brevirhabdus pacifica]OWU76612.1 cytochrome C oxidase assembly protein [Loktanella sp. 22II-4b]PJJ86008.1 hypothetical protein CLV77_0540 [Brevirhabdus pacifica]